jgi:hypothetical protein
MPASRFIQLIARPVANTDGFVLAQAVQQTLAGNLAQPALTRDRANGGHGFATRKDSDNFAAGDIAQQARKMSIGIGSRHGFHRTSFNVVTNIALFQPVVLIKRSGPAWPREQAQSDHSEGVLHASLAVFFLPVTRLWCQRCQSPVF